MKTLAFLGAALLSGAAAVAQGTAAEPAAKRAGPSGDPNQVICINQSEIGSRLARRRVCRTRAQWDELNSQSRQVIERVQFQKQTSGQ